MAGEPGNGQGNGKDPVVVALEVVVAELRGLRADTNARFESVEQVLRGHGRQLGELASGLIDFRAEVHEGVTGLVQKIESAAARDRRLEDGLHQLGERIARLEGRNPEPR